MNHLAILAGVSCASLSLAEMAGSITKTVFCTDRSSQLLNMLQNDHKKVIYNVKDIEESGYIAHNLNKNHFSCVP